MKMIVKKDKDKKEGQWKVCDQSFPTHYQSSALEGRKMDCCPCRIIGL